MLAFASLDSIAHRQSAAPKLLLAGEVAEILRVPTGRVYELVRQGRLPAVRVGRLVRIPEDALQEWIKMGGATIDAPVEGDEAESDLIH